MSRIQVGVLQPGAPADQATNPENQRHGGALQRSHSGRSEDPQVQQPRGYGADLVALCGPVQPPAAAIGTQKQDAYADDERVVRISPTSVSQETI